MRYSPLALIRALLETLGNALEPYPDKRKGRHPRDNDSVSAWSLEEFGEACSLAKDDPGKEYWQNLFDQHLDAKEKENEVVSEMMMQDYESRHGSEIDNGSQQGSGEAEISEGETMSYTDFADSTDFESGSDDSDSSTDSEGG